MTHSKVLNKATVIQVKALKM